jgi:DNA-binding NarL/FixJ family response regulator
MPDRNESLNPPSVTVRCGIPALRMITEHGLTEQGFTCVVDEARIIVVVDAPYGFALDYLHNCRPPHSALIVATGNTCSAYWEELQDQQPTVLLVGADLAREVADAVRRAAAGESYQIVPTDRLVLTPTERRVLRGIAHGLDNRQIAQAAGISEKTVQNVVSQLYAKLGVTNRVAAAARYWSVWIGHSSIQLVGY